MTTCPRKLLALVSVSILVPSAALAQAVRADGAAVARVLLEAAAADYQKQKPGARIELGVAGSAGSLMKLCGSSTDLAIASRPIQKPEIALCKEKSVEFVEVPVALDAIVVVVNPHNSFVESLSIDELRTMWAAAAQGKVTRWKQVNAAFPDAPLKLLGPDPQFEGGNTFTEAVLGSGQPSRRDYMVSVDDNVLIQGVTKDLNTLAYLSLPYYGAHQRTLKGVPIAAKAGAPAVEPTTENVTKGLYRPLTRPLFLYVNAKGLEGAPLREFVEYCLANGTRLSQEAGLVPLADSTYRLSLARIRSRTTGTAWDGTIPLSPTQLELQKRLAAL
jgi:phosphate transport system substrate-binding protein